MTLEWYEWECPYCRRICEVDPWKWADPPFALKSGTFDEYMALVERAVELGVIK